MSWYTGSNSKRVYLVDRGDELYRNDCPDYKVIVIDTSSVYTYYNLKCMGDRYMAATMRKKSNDFQKEFSPVHGDPKTKEELKENIKKKRIATINSLLWTPLMCLFSVCLVMVFNHESSRFDFDSFVIALCFLTPIFIYSTIKFIKDISK